MTATEKQAQNQAHDRLELLRFEERFKDSLLPGEGLKSLEEVGEGGFAVVYKCRLKTQDGAEIVAVKELKSALAYDKEVDYFLAEAQLMRNLQHPNIVEFKGVVNQIGNKTSSLAVVQEFMNLGTLKDYIVRQSETDTRVVYSPRQGLEWMLQVAKGLEYLHGLKATVIHRDLKPENILLTYNRGIRVKIADFGLSALVKKPAPIVVESGMLGSDLDDVVLSKITRKCRKLQSAKNRANQKILSEKKFGRLTSNLMRSLSVIERVLDTNAQAPPEKIEREVDCSNQGAEIQDMNMKTTMIFEKKVHNLSGRTGSLMYMAPEVHRSEKYNEKVDVYSFGVILFEVLSGYKITSMILNPELPSRPQIEKYTSKVANGYRPPIPTEWPDSMASLIEDCWAQDPGSRLCMSEVVTSLQKILTEEAMFQPTRRDHCSRACCFLQ